MEHVMPLVWAVARAHGVNADTASDVVQAVWLAFLENIASIRAPDQMVGWLVTVTRREALRAQDRDRRHEAAEPDEN